MRYRLVRRRSKIAGWGVFAGEPITKNSRIIDYAGEKVARAPAGRANGVKTREARCSASS